MNTRSIVAAFVVALAAVGCGDQPDAGSSDGTWGGTVATEGDVTTVVNESGSVWGGTARLVEELSIGAAQGDEPYMFGEVLSLWATDEELYVVDYQVPAVRVYDRAGRFLRNIGRPGKGPGEEELPSAVAVLPGGRITVRGYLPGQRINVYSPDGKYVDTW